VGFALAGGLLLHPAHDGALGAWDAATGARRGALLRAHAATVNAVAAREKTGDVFSGGDDGTIVRWAGFARGPLARSY
jgi:hypothetical protein